MFKDKEVLKYKSSNEKVCFDEKMDEIIDEQFNDEEKNVTLDDEDENLDFD